MHQTQSAGHHHLAGCGAGTGGKVHAYGGIVLHDVTNAYHAKKAADAGVDGIIAVAEGAGGHAGTQDAQTLVEDIRKVFDGIIVLAGGMTTGEDVYNAEKKARISPIWVRVLSIQRNPPPRQITNK